MNGIRPAPTDSALISSAGFRQLIHFFPVIHNYWKPCPAECHLTLRTMSISNVTSMTCHQTT